MTTEKRVRPFDPRQLGLTLIEVLVALAIVAITLSAGLKAAGGLTQNAQRVADMTVAQWCVENKFVDLKIKGIFPDIGDSQFSCAQLGREFIGKQNVRPSANPDFRSVEVKVLDEEGQMVVRVITVVLKP